MIALKKIKCVVAVSALLVAMNFQGLWAVGVSGSKLNDGSQGNPADRKGWESAQAGVSSASGVVIENDLMVLVAQVGKAGPVVFSKSASGQVTRVNLVLLKESGENEKITAVKIKTLDENEGVLLLSLSSGEVTVNLSTRNAFVTLWGGKGSLEVRSKISYTILPDLFGYDLVFDPGRFKGERVSVPAENFLLNLVEGGNSMVMCVWPGSLGRGNKEKLDRSAAKKAYRDPAVELIFAEKNSSRYIAASRVEFAEGPIHVAILEKENIWHSEDVSQYEVGKPIKIDWKRPYDAKWRLSTVVAEGKHSEDLMTRSQSYEPLYKPASLKRDNSSKRNKAMSVEKGKIWSKGYPIVYEEKLYSHIYPAWFDGADTYLAVYTDNPRAVLRGVKETSVSNNIYDLELLYPLDRLESTPLDVLTPVDIMRATLGRGPCEYIIDLEGIKPLKSSGTDDKKLVGNATCTIWKNSVNPILKDEIPEEKRTFMIRAIGDAIIFLHAVHDRITEYQQFNEKFGLFVTEAQKDEKVKKVAERMALISKGMKGMLKGKVKRTNQFEEFKKKLAEVDKGFEKITAQLKANKFSKKEIGRFGSSLRNLGQAQDNAVSECRRFVKAFRHEVSFIEGNSPEVRAFVASVRDRCAAILRKAIPKELSHSDSGSTRAHPERDPDWAE